MKEEGVPGIQGIDTRALTKIIREKGTILGRIVYDLPEKPSLMPAIVDPNLQNLVAKVSRVSSQEFSNSLLLQTINSLSVK